IAGRRQTIQMNPTVTSSWKFYRFSFFHCCCCTEFTENMIEKKSFSFLTTKSTFHCCAFF
ncbi:hypothetical protein Bhyg_01316, partial [Pseudolycoriella hygida]